MSYNKTKCDPELGQQVHAHLVKMGVETPMTLPGQPGTYSQSLTRTEQISKIEEHFTEIMKILHLDLTDDSLIETPLRWSKMIVNETMWGLDYSAFPKCTTVENKMQYDEMVVERNITVKSFCEHHILPIIGNAYVAYIPNKKVLGLSKIPRIVEYFSRRPQIQERLTEQIYYALQYVLETDNIAVVIHGEHTCVSMRGVEDTSADTVTSKLGGCFKDKSEVRAEFFKHIYR